MCAICSKYHLLIDIFNTAGLLDNGILLSWECTRKNKRVMITLKERKKKQTELVVAPIVIDVQI